MIFLHGNAVYSDANRCACEADGDAVRYFPPRVVLNASDCYRQGQFIVWCAEAEQGCQNTVDKYE